MSKDTKEIIGSVRIGGTVYQAGQEDELAAVLSSAQIDRLTEKGVIAGFSKTKAVEAAPEADKEPTGDACGY